MADFERTSLSCEASSSPPCGVWLCPAPETPGCQGWLLCTLPILESHTRPPTGILHCLDRQESVSPQPSPASPSRSSIDHSNYESNRVLDCRNYILWETGTCPGWDREVTHIGQGWILGPACILCSHSLKPANISSTYQQSSNLILL